MSRTKHTALNDQLVDLARNVWRLSTLVVDATEVGAGMASFLADQLSSRPRRIIVEPFDFTGSSKSHLGWDFIGLIDGGRVKEYVEDGSGIPASTAISWQRAPMRSAPVRGSSCAGVCRRAGATTSCSSAGR